jgi:UDP-N-acetylmuramoyl-L-alanyl-D-glutamate--2,6-diaminopimelate ligase
LRPVSVPGRAVSELAELLGVTTEPGAAEVLVTGVTHDSRAVRSGDLYAALPGTRTHGAEYAAAGAAAGAAAILTDPAGRERAAATGLPVLVVPEPRARLGAVAARVYGEPAAAMLLIGITGTNGKTTTAHFIEAGLRAGGRRTGLVGTVQTRIGDDAMPSVRTTPEATDLQAMFAVMRERGVDAVVMEVSSHALALGRVGGTTYDVAVFTNLSQDHLDFHADMDDYFQAKARLFTPEQARHAVIDIDDPYGRRLAAAVRIPVTTYSARGDQAADWLATDVALGAAGSTFHVRGPGAQTNGTNGTNGTGVAVQLPGRFNVANALGALVALVAAGVPADTATGGISSCPGVPGRMERVDAGQAFLAVVDYAHTPDAVATLLEALRPVTKGRLMAVLGCGGDRDRAKRPLMGAAAARLADVAVLTSDNPRSEDPLVILAAMEEGARGVARSERGEVVVVPDRAEAIALAVARAGPGDTVVVAGKGHEQGQEVAGVVRPFDDRSALRAAIQASGRARR